MADRHGRSALVDAGVETEGVRAVAPKGFCGHVPGTVRLPDLRLFVCVLCGAVSEDDEAVWIRERSDSRELVDLALAELAGPPWVAGRDGYLHHVTWPLKLKNFGEDYD